MRAFPALLPLFTLLGCPSKSDDTNAGDDTQAGKCTALTSGTDWAWDGECPQMPTPCDIVVDGCSFTIDYKKDGGMTMGMPYAGTVSGTTVTFEDGDSINGCVGEAKSADEIVGTCEGGCTFTLSR